MAITLLSPPAEAIPREEALDMGLSNDDAYAYSLKKKAADGTGDAVALLEEALENAPDSPGFYFSLAGAKFPSVTKSVELFVEGVKAYGRSFWWKTSILTLVIEALLFSIAIALTLVALIRLPRDLSLLTHNINEKKALLILPLIVFPMALLGPLPFVAGVLMLVSIYMKRASKAVAILALLLVALSPVWTVALGKLVSVSNPTVRAVVDVNEGRDNSLALVTLAGKEDFASRFSYAIALKRTGRAEAAAEIFQALIDERADYRLYNNLANAYVAMDRRDLAKAAYLKSIEKGESVINLYNLSQIYRDELDFESGDKYFKQAQALNTEMVSQYAARSSSHYNRLVIDETLTFSEIKKMALTSNVTNSVRGFPNGTIIPAALAGFLILLSLLSGKLVSKRAFRCKNCGRVACLDCAENDKICMDCKGKMAEDSDTSPKARVKRMLHANKQKERQMAVIRGLSFTPPGIAQIYSGRVFSGFVYLWFFSFSVLIIVLNPFMSTGLAGCDHSWIKFVVIPLVLFVYYISIMTTNRRLDRGWL
jgi:tetratricopeptide (TPR) repeat protein